MKKLLLSLFFACFLFPLLFGQGNDVFDSIFSKYGAENIHSKVTNRTVDLFGNYNFENGGFQMILERNLGDTPLNYHISKKEDLLKLQQNYQTLNERVPIFSYDCEAPIGRLSVFYDNQLQEKLQVDWDCGCIHTECGIFKFDPWMFFDLGINFTINNKEEIFSSKVEVIEYVQKIKKDANLIVLGIAENYKGIAQFEYIDSLNSIQQILKDSFYLDMIMESPFQRKRYEKMGGEGLVFETIINRQSNWHCELEEIIVLQREMPTYLVTIRRYNREDHPQPEEIENLISSWEETTYSIYSVWKSD